MDIQPLTPEEIENISGQHERIMELMACLDVHLFNINVELAQRISEYYEARKNLEQSKNDKTTIIERQRTLKALLSEFP
jgi:hypothetical protein